MRIASDGNISGKDYPTALAGQLAHPFHIRCLFAEAITQVDDFVFINDKLVETTGQLCRRASCLSVQQTETRAKKARHCLANLATNAARKFGSL
jgi:hypothetical protein